MVAMSDPIIELKGILFPLSVLYCQDFSVAALRQELSNKLAQAPGFFTQAPVVISVENCDQIPDLAAIKQLFTVVIFCHHNRPSCIPCRHQGVSEMPA